MIGKGALFILLILLLQNRTPTILFFGDSLTAGYGLSADEAFPKWVERHLRRKNLAVNVLNAGLSGETSAGGVERINWILRQPIDVLVLELGANDGLRGLPPEETKKNLQEIIDRVKRKYPHVQIVIAGMMVPPNLGAAYSSEFKAIFPALAKKNQAVLIPFLLDGVAGIEKLNLPDGIHPNAEGHRIVGETVAKAIEQVVKNLPAAK
jgi:acyl-CoA thioesterase-1